MSSFVFMKVLESTPERYDRGMQIISRGRIGNVYERIAETVALTGKKILDIGCGTGNLSIACASRGAEVVGFDINSGMLEVARMKIASANLDDKIKLMEIGVAEMTRNFEKETFDACVSCLAFSELTKDEQVYAISTAHSLLKPGGTLIIADEIRPDSLLGKVIHSLIRTAAGILAYLLTQSTTRPLDDVTEPMQNTGFSKPEVAKIWNDSFAIISATKRGE